MKSKKWIIALFIGFKFLLLTILSTSLSLFSTESILPVLISHDAQSYLQAAHNIVNYGTYSLSEMSKGEIIYYTGRMGGYETIIAIFLFFTSEKVALAIVVCLQVLLSVLSSFALANIAKQIFKSQFVYWCTLLLYFSNTYVSVFDISILSESLAISFVIISIHFIVHDKRRTLHYFLSGILITCSIFFRPYLILLVPVMIYYIIFEQNISTKSLRNVSIRLLFFVTPFMVCETAWVFRNYNVTGKFIPLVSDLHAQINYPMGFKSLMPFVQAWGGDIVWWNPKPEIVAFMKESSVKIVENKYSSIDSLPGYIYTPAYNRDSLFNIKKLLAIESDTLLPQSIRQKNGQVACLRLNEYTNSFIATKPFYYFIYAPFRLLSNFIVHSGTYNISSESFYSMNLSGKFYKLFYSGLYLLTLFMGLISMIYFIIFKRNPAIILIACAGLLMIILCPFVLRRIEYRYFVLCYPFLTIFTAYSICRIQAYFRKA